MTAARRKTRARLRGFPPLEPARSTARVLILGSLPGAASIAAQQYYAHPRNAFWPIMRELVRFDDTLDYSLRCARLCAAGVALWDVLAAGARAGSLDANIVRGTERANDIGALLQRHPKLKLIAFNGQTAATLFRRHIRDGAEQLTQSRRYVVLPSTSPAHAAMPFADKLSRWRAALEF